MTQTNHNIQFDNGNTDHTMTGLLTTNSTGIVNLCGEFNGQGFDLVINTETGEVELFQ